MRRLDVTVDDVIRNHVFCSSTHLSYKVHHHFLVLAFIFKNLMAVKAYIAQF